MITAAGSVKVNPYTIDRMTNDDPRFYMLLGPLIARREVVEELGSPVWDDDDKTWLIAHNDEGTLGFVAFQPRARNRWLLCSLYVTMPARKEVIGTTLVLRVLMAVDGAQLDATATPASVELFRQCGFCERGTRGRFTLMRANADA